MEFSYTVQRPFEGKRIYTAYRDSVAGLEFSRVSSFYAFASLKGAQLLNATLGESASWRNAVKRWIISIDDGLTEPDALRFLMSLRNSEVRIPDGEALLARRLAPVRRFHPKTMVVEWGKNAYLPLALVVGSANLTLNGLSLGHEHVMCTRATGRSRFPEDVLAQLNDLEQTVEAAAQIDAAFVKQYEQVRPTAHRAALEDEEDDRVARILQPNAVLPAQESAALASANNLWVQIDYVVPNRGRGVEGNQIDLKRGTRVFFGFGDRPLPRNSPIGTISVVYQGHAAQRNLRFGNNSMDKLDLPIPGADGPPTYTDTTLLFTREDGGHFRMAVAAGRSSAQWRATSRRLGTMFRMQSGREFGVF